MDTNTNINININFIKIENYYLLHMLYIHPLPRPTSLPFCFPEDSVGTSQHGNSPFLQTYHVIIVAGYQIFPLSIGCAASYPEHLRS